jgi:hypothetical protein
MSLKEDFDIIKDDLIKSYDAKGMRASGDFAESLEVRDIENGIQLWGNAYGEQLEFGRKPTTRGGDGSLKDRIAQWIKDKGIVANDISEKSLIYLITRKIHEQGWDRKDYGGVELVSEIITNERLNEIAEKNMTTVMQPFIEVMQGKIKLLQI